MLVVKRNLATLMQFVALVALALVLFNVARIGVNVSRSTNGVFANSEFANATFNADSGGRQLPDIYYIVLDGYGREDVLEQNFAYVNKEFTDWLAQKGFFVASNSRSNYVHTHLSMAASLNIRYLTEKENAGELVKENGVTRFLQGLGYQYVHFGSGWAITKRSKRADTEVVFGNRSQLLLNEFSAALARHTIAAALAKKAGLNLDSAFTENYAKRFNHNMKKLRDIPDIPGSTFTFNHNMQPHPPYIFDRDGNRPPSATFELTPTGGENTEIKKYIDQLIYVNKSVKALVDDLLRSSPEEPIIIIQGDHGPYSSDSSGFDDPSDRFVLERTAIFNVYYLPEYCRSGLYSDISPVNTFRAVFDSCLGTEFGLLEDKSYWRVNEAPIDFSQLRR